MHFNLSLTFYLQTLKSNMFHDPDLVFLRNTIVPQNLKDKRIVGRVERQG